LAAGRAVLLGPIGGGKIPIDQRRATGWDVTREGGDWDEHIAGRKRAMTSTEKG
jgi:hypothetical protein